MLAQQGLLEVRPRKGVRIWPFPWGHGRGLLGSDRTREPGRGRCRSSRLQQRELGTPKIGDRQYGSSDRRPESGGLGHRPTINFHSELVRLGGNSRVQSIVTMMSDQVRRARSITLHIRPLPVKSNEDHRELYEAIKRGDPLAAREIHRRHRSQARELLVGILHRHRLSFL